MNNRRSSHAPGVEQDPDTNPPGNLDPVQVPQFVIFGNDDLAYTGLDGEGGLTNLIEMFSGKTNPAGNGNDVTFDGKPIQFTMYGVSEYIANWAPESTGKNKQVWRAAIEAGHEIGNHTRKHDNAIEDNYTVEDYIDEISHCEEWLTKPYDEDNLDSSSTGLGMNLEQILGFRSPFLAYNDNLFKVLSERNYRYDCSIEEGYETEDADGTDYFWPYTLHNGSPANPKVDNYPGLWEIPVYPFHVPPDNLCEQYGVEPGFRDTMASVPDNLHDNEKDYFNEDTGRIRGADYDLWHDYKMTAAQFLATLKYTLDLRLQWNRTPMTICVHTDFYHKNPWGNSNFSDVSYEDRLKALSDFLEYANGKENVRIVTVQQMLAWLENPTPL